MSSFNKLFLLSLLWLFSLASYPYSTLTHEAFIDESWDHTIKPFLLSRYPDNNSEEDLRKAKAFCYGGAVMPDIGYYPFGSKMFTNLIHYVRGGDFMRTLINESTTIYELSFALGMLSHYTADNNGHAVGVNPSVPLEFPKLKKKFGDTVTFEDNPTAHKRIEFSFDVLQVSRGKYAPSAYHDFVGFEIAEDLLKRTFYKTYNISLEEVFPDLKLSLTTFRWFVEKGFPLLTKASWKAEKKKVKETNQRIEKNQYIYHLSRKDFKKQWGKPQKAGPFATVLAVIIKVLPKIGPLKPLSFKPLEPEVEKKFLESFHKSLTNYYSAIKELEEKKSLSFENRDMDTGHFSGRGEYCLADLTYLDLIGLLRKNQYRDITEDLKRNIIKFYEKNGKASPEIFFLLNEIRNLESTKNR